MSQYKESDYYFLVFKIEDKEQFAQFTSPMLSAMAAGERIQGAHVVAAGEGDIATERDALADHLLHQYGEHADAIIQDFINEEGMLDHG